MAAALIATRLEWTGRAGIDLADSLLNTDDPASLGQSHSAT